MSKVSRSLKSSSVNKVFPDSGPKTCGQKGRQAKTYKNTRRDSYMIMYVAGVLSFPDCVCLSACLSVCLTVYLFVCLSVCLSTYLNACLTDCLFVFFSVRLSDCLSVCLPHWLSVWLFPCLPICLFCQTSGAQDQWRPRSTNDEFAISTKMEATHSFN